MPVGVLWVAIVLLACVAAVPPDNEGHRLPADLVHSPVELPQKESRLILNPFSIMGNPFCEYQGLTGTCYGEIECLALAGRYGNFCSGLTGLCCLFFRTCGMRTSQRTAYFRNSQYPLSDRAFESCTMNIIKRSEEYCALRVNMEEADLPKPSRTGLCNEAAYMVGGSRNSRITAKCGDLTGYSYMYDMGNVEELQLTINSSMVRSGLSWSMKVEQIPCSEYSGVEDLEGTIGGGGGGGTDSGPDVDIGTGPGTGTGTDSVTGPDGGTDLGGPTGPVLPPGVKPPAPPPTTGAIPGNMRCGIRGEPFHKGGHSRVPAARRMTLLGPLGPDMTAFTGRRKGAYPRPGETFRWPGSNYRGQEGSQNRPFRRKNNENRRNQSTNRKQVTRGDSKETSATRQGTSPAREDEDTTRAVTTHEWGVPGLNESLFHQYLGDRSFFANRITFGHLAGIKEFPWQVAMVVRGKFHCGAVIVGEYHILTAAHCVVSYKSTPHILDLTLGDWDLSATNDGPSMKAVVEKVTVHNAYSRSTLQNDIAILKLTKKIDFTDDIKPICLPERDEAIAGRAATISGWGRNEKQKLQPQLHFLEADIVTNVKCDDMWNKLGAAKGFIAQSMMCMDSSSGDSCNGDSGGPAVMEIPQGSNQYVLVGLVSFGSGSCVDEALPGVYTRVAYYRKWIADNMV